MAPTICSEKKTQIRSGIKDIRKQSTTSSLSISHSTAINYVQKRSKQLRSCPVRMKQQQQQQSTQSFRQHISSSSNSSDASGTGNNIERFVSPQSPLSSISDNSISTSSESSLLSLLSPLSLSSFPSPSSVNDCSPCAERLNPFYYNCDSSMVFSNIGKQENDVENSNNNNDEISRQTSNSQNTATTDKSSNSRPFSMLQVQHQAKNTKGLFDIAIKTIKLVRRNQLLQRRLAQLQFETSEFIQSVLANPENRALRDKMQAKTSCDREII